MSVQVRSFHHHATGTWSHVLVDPESRTAAIVDPVLDFDAASGRIDTGSAQRILEYVRTTGLRIEWILETHAHADHLTAAAWLKRVLTDGSAAPAVGIGHGILGVQETFRRRFNLDASFVADGRQFDALFHDGDNIRIGALEVHVLATPGHTPDGVAYLVGDACFVGDTLFAPHAGTARCDFPGADAATLFRSIQRLYSLPDETRLYLAHDYPEPGAQPLAQSTVAEEKTGNVHVRTGISEASFVEMRRRRDAGLDVPRLLWPALQVNIRAGHLPPAESDGQTFLKIPLQREGFET
jgi:glyoxylase-like metal-dependent hydrolase (beta-lactamase superfamily II)